MIIEILTALEGEPMIRLPSLYGKFTVAFTVAYFRT